MGNIIGGESREERRGKRSVKVKGRRGKRKHMRREGKRRDSRVYLLLTRANLSPRQQIKS